MSDYEPQHISEQIEIFKKDLTAFSKAYYKFSSELPHFMFKNKMIQADILEYFYEHNSKLEGLLREIMDNDLNGETIRPIHYSCEHGHSCNDSEEDDDDEGEKGGGGGKGNQQTVW